MTTFCTVFFLYRGQGSAVGFASQMSFRILRGRVSFSPSTLWINLCLSVCLAGVHRGEGGISRSTRRNLHPRFNISPYIKSGCSRTLWPHSCPDNMLKSNNCAHPTECSSRLQGFGGCFERDRSARENKPRFEIVWRWKISNRGLVFAPIVPFSKLCLSYEREASQWLVSLNFAHYYLTTVSSYLDWAVAAWFSGVPSYHKRVVCFQTIYSKWKGCSFRAVHRWEDSQT